MARGRRQQKSHVVARVGALLRAVGACEPTGASTTELGKAAGLARPTAHRLLTSLAAEGLIDRDAQTGRWSLGPELYLLGAGAANRYDIIDQARDMVNRLARETGESAYLSARRGDETVCVLSEEGSFPLRSHVLACRHPLSAGCGIGRPRHPQSPAGPRGRRLFLPGRSRIRLGAQVIPRDRSEPGSNATRTTGYAVNPALIVEGSWGIGAAVFDGAGDPPGR